MLCVYSSIRKCTAPRQQPKNNQKNVSEWLPGLLRTAVEQAAEVLIVADVQAGHARCVRLWQAPQPFQLPRHVAIRVIAGEMPCVELRRQNEPAYVLPKLSTPTGLSGSAYRSSRTLCKSSMNWSFSAERATRRRMRALSRGA